MYVCLVASYLLVKYLKDAGEKYDLDGSFFLFMEKQCTKCKTEKPIEQFSKHVRYSDGLRKSCKSCEAEYRKANRESRNEYNKQYWLKHPEKQKEVTLRYRQNNREKLAAKTREAYAKNGYVYTDRKAYFRKNYAENKEKINKRKTATRKANPELYKEHAKRSREKNKESISRKNKERWRNDPLVRVMAKIRSNIYKSIKRKSFDKKGKTEHILGCSYDFFIQYIEAQFTKGMSWKNATIDHIKPIVTAKTEEELYHLNHYTNLQPLFKPDNSSKKDKLITKQLRLI